MVPLCQAPRCRGVADDRTHLCAGHRRAMTFTVKLQDSVREYLHGTQLYSAFRPTQDNTRKIVEAGEYLAIGSSLLLSVLFDDVMLEPEPITVGNLTHTPQTPWRVRFDWQASELRTEDRKKIEHDDDDDNDDLEELS